MPGSRRRSSANESRPASMGLADKVDRKTLIGSWMKNTLYVVLVCVTGAIAWAIAYSADIWKPTPVRSIGADASAPLGAEILGYLSALLYLG